MPVVVLALLLSLASAPAAADFTVTGDWTIAVSTAYADETITVLNTTNEEGNVTVAASATLTLQNVTLILPFQSSLVLAGQADIRNSTVTGETWQMWIQARATIVDSLFVNATDGGILVDSTDAFFSNMNFSCFGSAGSIHLRRVLDFRNNTMFGCVIAYELPVLSADRTMEISNNTWTGPSSSSAITWADAYHTGHVTYNVHDNLMYNTDNAVEVGVTAPNTTFLLHDMVINTTGVAAVRALSFEGALRIWNVTFIDVFRAIRLEGPAGASVFATLDNTSVSGTQDGILVVDATLTIRNSTISGPSPQYVAGSNGRILVYDTSDNAFAASTPSAGGSIEHFIFLNLGVLTWQGGVAITDDVVSLRTMAGPAFIDVTPSNWTPRVIVWWGMYPGPLNVDNRDLRPAIVDGGRTFNCTPSSFFVSPGMSRVDVVCTDDFLPAIAIASPGAPSIQNNSTLRAVGSVTELGAGLTSMEWSIDGVSFAPVVFNDSRNFTLSAPSRPDGAFTLQLRATDRVGNLRLFTWGPITIDTIVPSLGIVSLPEFLSSTTLRLEGVTEPNTTIKAVRASGFQNQTRSSSIGSFALDVLLEEGLNVYTVTVTDAAGNSMSLTASTTVDTVPPALIVFLEGAPDATARLRTAVLHITGTTETLAVVAVNGAPATRNGPDFSLDFQLALGQNNLSVTATDRAGNVGRWYGVALFDADPPTLRFNVSGVDAGSPLPIVTRSGSVTVEGRATDAITGVASLVVNGGSYSMDASGFFSLALTLSEGDNTVSVSASDFVGNVATLAVRVVKDTQAPMVTVNVVEESAPVIFLGGVAYTNGSSARLSIVVTEPARVTIDGAPFALTPGSNNFTLPLDEGRNAFALAFNDSAGNPAAPSTVVIMRDSTPPPLSISEPAAGAFVNTAVVEVVGTAEPFATVRVNGQAATVSAAGEFRVAVTLQEGANTIQATATDQVGNLNSTAITVSHSEQSPNNPASGAEGLPFLLLGVGLAAGAVIGAVVMRSRAPRIDKAEPPAEKELHARGPHEPHQRGPQGPRPPPSG